MIHFAAIDVALIVVYFTAVVYVGMRAKRRARQGKDDYILAGRTLTLPMFVATLVSTWYGGILGIGEFTYRYGLSNWLVFGVPYYLFALLFALFLAKKARQTQLATIPDKLFESYGLKTSLLGAFLTFLLVTPAPYVLMLGIMAQIIFGWPLWLCVLLTVFITIVYLIKGGLRADVHVNILEFVLMFAGFALILGFAYHQFGGMGYLRQNLPPQFLQWHGGHSWQYIMVWFFIALWTLVDPAFHQRCYAALDGKTARNGILVSILFWMVFDFLTTATGLYARAAVPRLDHPSFSYPLLAETILPQVAKGLFFTGLLATIMSTLSSLTFIAGTTVGNDLVGRWLKETHRPGYDEVVKKWSQIGILAASVLAAGIALGIPSVVKIWYAIGTAVIPGLLLPLLLSYSRKWRMSGARAFICMLAAWLTSLIWLIAGQWRGGHYWFGIEPMYPGLGVSLILAITGIRRKGRQSPH
ncbi:sodium:solute symporter family protein [candidate division KSB1 bacterium]|nr:sodium:solute symporter family protein [candidate division KSB1 bacterium]